ncbi:MAG: hypothetical protein M1819_001354 [Sarea resinae]|nr:MAG: hypothetical protein M1819_001354 [Sarea resinae]
MCIVLISTAHPCYPLILIDNRDEYLTRPTAPAAFWPHPNAHVLGGRDLLRPIQGTWLGITNQGRIAVLTNFREEGVAPEGVRSRGAMVNAFLTVPPESDETTDTFVRNLLEGEDVSAVGGFSLVCGRVRRNREGLVVVSNRTPKAEDVTRIAHEQDKIYGLSNAAYGDKTWPKVVKGEELMRQAIRESVECGEGKHDFIQRMMRLLSIDTLPRRRQGEDWEIYLRQLRNSVFIPAIQSEGTEGASSDQVAAARGPEKIQPVSTVTTPPPQTRNVYGTQKQTVVLVDSDGHVTFTERTLFDENAQPIAIGKGDRTFEFTIEHWDES